VGYDVAYKESSRLYVKVKLSEQIRTKSFQKRVSINVGIGLVIFIALLLMQGKPLVTRVENVAMDLLIKFQQRLVPTPEKAVPFVLVDINEETYRGWGNPYFVPRERLAELITFALSGKPLAVIVDIGVSERGLPPTYKQPGVDALVKSLSEAGDEAPPSPVLFVASSQNSLKSLNKRELRSSFLDAVIDNQESYFRFAPLFHRDQYDQKVRRWKLYEGTCTDQVAMVIPSAQLLVATLVSDGLDGVQNLKTSLAELKPGPCVDGKTSGEAMFQFGEKQINLHGDRLANRIIYSIPWDQEKKTPRQVERVPFKGTEVDLVTHIGAEKILDNENELNPIILNDRIVVIGGTYEDARDWHMTPVGYMPGAAILINATHSLLQYGQMQKPKLWIMIIAELIMIFVASVVFALLHSFVAKLVGGLIVLVAMVPITFYVFKYGIWLDFALPFLAIQIHETIAKWEQTIVGQHT